MPAVRKSLDDAKLGHYLWELQRRPDEQKGPDLGVKEYWVAVAVELTSRAGVEIDRGKVQVWLKVIKKLDTQIKIGAFEEERLLSDVDAKVSTARMTFLVARCVLDDIESVGPTELLVKVIAIGEPFLPGEFTFPAHIPPTNLAAMRASDGVVGDVVAKAATVGPPLVGIIDDGIAFLNRRFCAKSGTGFDTRFKAVWLQAEVIEKTSATAVAKRNFDEVPFGFVLEQDDLNDLLAKGETDAEVYRRFNQILYSPPSQQATNTRLAHGTHVLDLAAGEEPGQDGVPLIAVQLAPGTALGTSGRRLELFLVMGLRWMVHRAVREDRNLVVNVSLGTLAGPGDETNFVADAIAKEIAAFESLTEAAGTPRKMRVVIAYGNSWRGDLVAEFAVKAGETRSVDWRILPDGYSSSYLELRVPDKAGDVAVQVIPPTGHAPELDRAFNLKTNTAPMNSAAGGVLAQILPLPDETTAKAMLIAVAPTASLTPGDKGLAPPGAWKVAVTAGTVGCTVTLRVQRNDTPTGYGIFGRQSWLADHDMGHWDSEMRDYTEPGKDSAIKREGTSNAYAGLPDMKEEKGLGIYYVGAVRPDAAHKGEGRVDGLCTGPTKPALYTSEGLAEGDTIRDRSLNIKSKGPTLAARGDDGRFFAGRRATHVTSGQQSQRLSGTSISAGLVTRRVAEAFAAGKIGGASEVEAVLGDTPTTMRDSRIGHGIVKEK